MVVQLNKSENKNNSNPLDYDTHYTETLAISYNDIVKFI